MQSTRATRGYHRHGTPGDLGVGPGGERGSFFVADVDEVELAVAAADCVNDWICGVADNAINVAHTGFDHHFHKIRTDCLCHISSLMGSRNLSFGSQPPHTIDPARESRALFFLWQKRGCGTGVSVVPTRVVQLL